MKFKKLLSQKLREQVNMSLRVAFADEGITEPTTPTAPTQPTEPTQNTEPTPAQAQPTPTINFEQLISNARQEEKAKLYPEITKLKSEKEAQTKRINELIIQVAEKDEQLKQKDAELKKATSNKVDSEEVKTLKLKVEELTNSLALKDSELAEIKLNAYRESKIKEVGEELIPELVKGTTQEEIDASIVVAQQAYQSIISRIKPVQATPQVNTPMQQIPQVNPTIPVVNPTVNPVQATGMDISALSRTSMFDSTSREQYKQLRKQLGL